MHAQVVPNTQDLVFIGAGHTHALVLKAWAMSPLPGVRLTLINPIETAAYSGMLPGFVAGHYALDELKIDVIRLARAAGARVILDAVTHIDVENRRIDFRSRCSLHFDLASIDVGITSQMPNLPGFAEFGIPAKPLDKFAQHWDATKRETKDLDIAVIGAGVAGAELALAMNYAVQSTGRTATVALLDRSRALTNVHPKTRRGLLDALSQASVALYENTQITALTDTGLLFADGTRLKTNFTVGAAGAHPHAWLVNTGLATVEGFVEVDATLRTSDPHVFAVGDCAHMASSPRPKAGVFAVRQAPVLLHNLKTALIGQGGMKAYKPQKDYLKLISLGGKSALADRAGLRSKGEWLWWLKDRIDRKFMRQFEEIRAPKQPALPWPRAAGVRDDIAEAPPCGGCGSKIGVAALREGLKTSSLGSLRDDAAFFEKNGRYEVLSTDHLRAFWQDPVVMTRIAAIHALGDIWAMGAIPTEATATVIVPRQNPNLAARSLAEIMQTAEDVFEKAGGTIVGGHSSLGAELTIGFTVTGYRETRPVELSGARPGDVLVLTKPLGTGVIMAAEMQFKARPEWVANALRHMTRPQSDASLALSEAHAMTDVTGFGLAGHLANMCSASGTGAMLSRDTIPLLEGALDLSALGVRSSLFAENKADFADWPSDPFLDLLFDPQTAGGLLAAVDPAKAPEILSQNPAFHRIGVMTDQSGQVRVT